ncbi:LuxR C-terminal-related transcriptional regulator [Pseudescherichia vulneris]|uniref:helix-turn-helix domain-containing protein n=1 Tax=Pseudescherichia vulneris TaxID=566 RepID=UPI00227B6B2B|nr:LuxR C-terminal-related transcriptional regulator [Pseudescherichia vulneris]WAH51473.1 LuxR C-terminal-related transcriptional regulator [Pseudescherichia vulneris]
MLPEKYRCAVVISRAPVIQRGLVAIMEESLHEYEVICCSTQQETNFSLLQRASIVIVDLTNDLHKARSACREYAAMMVHLTETHWIFMVPLQIYPMAVELLLRSESTLLSSMEPIDGIINAIRSGSRRAGKVSEALLSPHVNENESENSLPVSLTYSERQVLRLISKGWCINQIAAMLKKSNKTVSAQKNSAMRRLSLRSNADLFAWINSSQGANILNLNKTYGDDEKWKTADQENTLPLLNNVP